MSDELFYTSAVRGLRPGTGGFCTVAVTAGLGPAWQQRLEAVSGYKALYPVGHPQATNNPVAFAHTVLTVAGQTRSVLTRAAFSGADHTGRSNKLVHHLLPAPHEKGPGGPAYAMRQPHVMAAAFAGDPRPLPAGRPVPTTRPPAAPTTTWQHATGNPAWAAALASVALADPSAIVYVVYAPGTDALALFDEALRLLPESRRWAVTFNTYVTEPPAGPCAWRGVIAGTPAAAMATGTVIDLTNLDPAGVPTGAMAETARTGRAPRHEMSTPAASEEQSQSDGSHFFRREAATPQLLGVSAMNAVDRSNTHNPQGGVPSNVRLNDCNAGGAGRKVVIIVSVAAALMICATVVGTGLWLLKQGRAVAAVPATLPTTRPHIAEEAGVKPLEETVKDNKTATTRASLLSQEAAANAEADRLTVEKEANKRAAAAEAAKKKEAEAEAEAKRIAAERLAAEKKSADEQAKAVKDAADRLAAERAAAAEAKRIATAKEAADKARSFPLPTDREQPLAWDVIKLPAIKISDAKAIDIYKVFAQLPWTTDYKNNTTGAAKSISFSVTHRNTNYIDVLDGAVLKFSVTIEGNEVKCDFADRLHEFKTGVLSKAGEKLKSQQFKKIQVDQIKQILDGVRVNGLKIKVTPQSASSYMLELNSSSDS